MPTFSATTASPFFLNCRATTASSGSDSMPSICSVAPRASGVGRELIALGQLLHRHRAKLHSRGGLARLDFVVVVDHASASLQQTQVAIHRVLVERDEDVDLVAHAADRRVAGPNGEESVAAANDRLVGVVGVEVQAAPREDAGQNVSGGGDALTVLATDPDREIHFGEFCHLVYGPCTLLSGANFCKFKHRQILFMSIPAEIERVFHLQSSEVRILPARHVLRREPCPAI